MATVPAHYLTPDQYLEQERASDQKHEYFEGQMILMARGPAIHAGVCANMIGVLGNALRQTNYLVFGSDLRVSVSWDKLITYPDVSVACLPLEFTDDEEDTITNPTLITEVLSRSTASHDRGAKLRYYRLLASLREYLLVDPETTNVEHGWRLPNGNWEIEQLSDRSATIELPSMEVRLPVEEIYHNVELFKR